MTDIPVFVFGTRDLLPGLVIQLQEETERWRHVLEPLSLDIRLFQAPRDLSDRLLVLAGPVSGRGRVSFHINACGRTPGSVAAAAIGELVERLYLHGWCEPATESAFASARELLASGFDVFPVDEYLGHPRYPATWPYPAYSDTMRASWLLGEELSSGRPMWVPRCFAVGSTRREELSELTSIGMATATSLDAATRHALDELLERDALMRCWLLDSRFLAIDPSWTGMSEFIDSLTSVDDDVKWQTALGAQTTHAGLVAFLVVSRDVGRSLVALGSSAGDASTALSHAIDEMVTGRFVVLRYPPQKPLKVSTFADHVAYYCHPDTAPELDTLIGGAGQEVLINQLSTSRIVDAMSRVGSVVARVTLGHGPDAGSVVRVLASGLLVMEANDRLGRLPRGITAGQVSRRGPHPFA